MYIVQVKGNKLQYKDVEPIRASVCYSNKIWRVFRKNPVKISIYFKVWNFRCSNKIKPFQIIVRRYGRYCTVVSYLMKVKKKHSVHTNIIYFIYNWMQLPIAYVILLHIFMYFIIYAKLSKLVGYSKNLLLLISTGLQKCNAKTNYLHNEEKYPILC